MRPEVDEASRRLERFGPDFQYKSGLEPARCLQILGVVSLASFALQILIFFYVSSLSLDAVTVLMAANVPLELWLLTATLFAVFGDRLNDGVGGQMPPIRAGVKGYAAYGGALRAPWTPSRLGCTFSTMRRSWLTPRRHAVFKAIALNGSCAIFLMANLHQRVGSMAKGITKAVREARLGHR